MSLKNLLNNNSKDNLDNFRFYSRNFVEALKIHIKTNKVDLNKSIYNIINEMKLNKDCEENLQWFVSNYEKNLDRPCNIAIIDSFISERILNDSDLLKQLYPEKLIEIRNLQTERIKGNYLDTDLENYEIALSNLNKLSGSIQDAAYYLYSEAHWLMDFDKKTGFPTVSWWPWENRDFKFIAHLVDMCNCECSISRDTESDDVWDMKLVISPKHE